MPKTQELCGTMVAFVECMLQQNYYCKFELFSGTGHDDLLKAVDLPIVNNERCREMHRGNLHITNTKICAGGKRNEGVCEVNCYLFLFFS